MEHYPHSDLTLLTFCNVLLNKLIQSRTFLPSTVQKQILIINCKMFA